MDALYRYVANNLHSSPYLSFILSGVLIGVPFAYSGLWFLALPGVALFFYAIESGKNIRGVIFGSFVTGTLKAGIALSWYHTVYPADWLGGPSVLQQILLLGGSWFGSAISVGAGAVVTALCVFHLRTLSPAVRIVSYSFAFILGDICGAFFFSMYTLGDGNPVNAYFGFTMLGYLLADHTLLRIIATYTGIFGLTYTLALLSASFLTFARAVRSNKLVFVLCVVCFFYASGLTPLEKKNVGTTIVASVSTNFTPAARVTDKRQAQHRAALETGIKVALEANAHIVLLPEDVRFGDGESEENTRTYLRTLPHTKNAVVIDSSRIQISTTSAYLRAFIHDIDNDRTYITDKRYMVPVGEFLPTLHKAAVTALEGLEYFEGMQYVGHVLEVDAQAPAYVPNVMFCFESGVANIAYSKNENRMSNLIVHPVSHGWFHTPKALWNEERQMLTIQALYAQTPIVQAGNKAPSVLYRADGTNDTGTVIFSEKNVTVTLFTI